MSQTSCYDKSNHFIHTITILVTYLIYYVKGHIKATLRADIYDRSSENMFYHTFDNKSKYAMPWKKILIFLLQTLNNYLYAIDCYEI